MTLITRVSRLFRADMHAVLDRIEEPDLLLRQAVREMEEAIGEDQRRLRQLTLEHDQLGSKIADTDRSLDNIDGELDTCFESDEMSLARVLIRRKLESERLKRVLMQRREQQQSRLSELRDRLDQQLGQLEMMQQKLDLLTEEEQNKPSDAAWSLPEVRVTEEDIELALLRERQRRGQS